MRADKAAGDSSNRQQNEGNTRRYAVHDSSIRKQKQADDADMNLARTIMQNSKFSISGQADDEYDFEGGPKRKSKKKVGNDHKSSEKANYPTRIMAQQERCQFYFENPSRPRHLVVAISNFTYLSLPHWQSVVPCHCCILTLQELRRIFREGQVTLEENEGEVNVAAITAARSCKENEGEVILNDV